MATSEFGSIGPAAATGTAVAGPAGTIGGAVLGAAIGVFTSVVSTDQKEAQREQYLNAQAADAQNGNLGALKLIYDWANGISATEWDGTNRGNEPNESKLFAQQILMNLQKNGITYNPSAGLVSFPGVSALGATTLSALTQGNGIVGLVELVAAFIGVVLLTEAIIGGG
jgi:hypothetical protein